MWIYYIYTHFSVLFVGKFCPVSVSHKCTFHVVIIIHAIGINVCIRFNAWLGV